MPDALHNQLNHQQGAMVMMNIKSGAKSAGAVVGLVAAALFALSTPAGANPAMGDHCMSMPGHGMEHMSPMEPHNAAAQFLKMAPMLKLSDNQVQQLTKMRDQYINNNAKTEEQIKAAYSDLARAMFSDEFNVAQTTTLVDNIGKMESQLWHAYLQQVHDIKALLTPEQKQALKDMWKHPHHGMMEDHMPKGHGDMPMGHDDMHKSM
jgi:Spy/CpxP family protein refolding chaperone